MRHVFTILLLATCAWAQKPIGEVHASDASVKGSVQLGQSGATLMSGAQISAGSVTAQVNLQRGGVVNVCPRSTVIVTGSATGEELMFAMSAGGLETHYKLGARSDAIMTPDFRIQLSGPGTFHLAVSIKPGGETCVESLPDNGSSAIITEIFGDATYQLKTGKSVVLKGGHMEGAEEKTSPGCGCPLPGVAAPPPKLDPGLNFPKEESEKAAALIAEGKPLPAPDVSSTVEGSEPGKVYAKVDAPFVFDGKATTPSPAALTPEKTEQSPFPKDPYPTVQSPPEVKPSTAPVQPPAANPQPTQKEPNPPKKKWYQRLGSAFSRIFK